jgi:hypothetical protein
LKGGRHSRCLPDPVVVEPISTTAKEAWSPFLIIVSWLGRKVTKMRVLCMVFLLCQMGVAFATGPEKYVEATNRKVEAECMNPYNHVEVGFGLNVECSQT